MALLNIDEFSSYFKGGAKSYLFEWTPNTKFLRNDFKFLVRASSVPSTSIEEIVVEYQQINFKMGGKKNFEDWTISLNIDPKSDVRKKFEDWSNKIHEVGDNKYVHHYSKDYVSIEEFYMLDGNGNKLLTVKLFDAWPKTIGSITMDYSSQDFAQFDVTFSYLYHIIT